MTGAPDPGQDFRRELAAELKHAGVDSPEAEAEIIISELAGNRKLYQSCDFMPTPEQRGRATAIAARRAKHEPLQYILGHAPFMDLELAVTPDTLIPRPETELLAERAVLRLPRGGRMLDLGTGSGAIALALGYARSDVDITAVDISPAALAVARANASSCGLDKIRFLESDLFAVLGEDEKFDFIAANLPYVGEKDYRECAPEIIMYEPELALLSGDDGMALTKQAAVAALTHLNGGGEICFEIAYDQGPRLLEFLREFWPGECEVIKDLNGFDRFVSCRN